MGQVMSVSVIGFSPGAALLVDEATADQLGPGLVAFTIVVLLGVATFFLIRSMLYHIRKVPPTFDNDASDDGTSDREEGQESSGSSGSGVGKP
jgi:hypothetical protein